MHTINIKKQKILFISDTHGKHRKLSIPKDINVIVHCGDICNDGSLEEISDFFNWYSDLDIPHKIFINGNHDLPFELEPMESKQLIPKNVIWLNDESISIGGITLKALSPFLYFQDFVVEENIDVLISHYPPFGILDDGIGSKELRDFVINSKPNYFVFGHNHNGFGQVESDGINFLNATVFNQINL